MQYRDYYDILGVEKTASDKEIKAAFRKKAKEYHPDLHPDDADVEQKFKEVNEAYEVLSDPEKRKQYDTFGHTTNFTGGQDFDPSQYGYTTYTSGGDFSDFFETLFGGRGPNKTRGFSMGDLGDLFADIGGRGRTSRKAKPQDVFKSELSISIKEAFEGTERIVPLRVGERTVDLPVKIPAGITTGKKIRVNGQKFDLPGNVLFTIRVLDGAHMRLDGLDIVVTVPVAPWQAALGDRVVVDTLEGKLKVKVAPGSRGDERLRIAGKGFKDRKGKRGDLFVQWKLVLPEHLFDEEKRLYEELKSLSHKTS